MNDLDLSVVPLSRLERTQRIDAQHYSHRYLGAEQRVREAGGVPLTEIADVSDGNHFTITDAYADRGVPYFRGQDVSGTFFADSKRAISITSEAYDRPFMRRSHLKSGDVLLSIVGTIGATALVSLEGPATCSCKLAILRPKHIGAGYLAAYLSSSFGQLRIQQLTRGAVQQGLILEDADQILIPRLGSVEGKIEALVEEAGGLRRSALEYMAEAENRLLEHLGLSEWSPPEPLTYVRSASEARRVDRLDAGHFKPAFAELTRQIESRSAYAWLADCVSLNTRGKQPEFVENGDLAVVASQDLHTPSVDFDTLASTDRKILEEEAYESAIIRHSDVLVYSTGAYVGRSAIYLSDKPALASNHVNILRVRQLDPVYLTLVLNSPVGRVQTAAWARGSAQAELYSADIGRFLIPILPEEQQRSLRVIFEKGQRAFDRAKLLLGDAIRAIEAAIASKGQPTEPADGVVMSNQMPVIAQ